MRVCIGLKGNFFPLLKILTLFYRGLQSRKKSSKGRWFSQGYKESQGQKQELKENTSYSSSLLKSCPWKSQ